MSDTPETVTINVRSFTTTLRDLALLLKRGGNNRFVEDGLEKLALRVEEISRVPPEPSKAMVKRLREECEKYGLPVSLDALLRHIYNNHAATLGFKDLTIHMLEEKLAVSPGCRGAELADAEHKALDRLLDAYLVTETSDPDLALLESARKKLWAAFRGFG